MTIKYLNCDLQVFLEADLVTRSHAYGTITSLPLHLKIDVLR